MAKMYCFSFAILMFAEILISGNEQVMGKSCEGDVLGLVSQCEKYVSRSGPQVKPSWGCCEVVKTVDVPCVCNLVNKDIEKVIDMAKVVYVAQSCGKTVAPGTKCGSYTVPPA